MKESPSSSKHMSKWKDRLVRITEIVKSESSSYPVYGLGTDMKMYKWNTDKGRWEKAWTDEDDE